VCDSDEIFRPQEPLFVDSWGWIVLANVPDAAHATVIKLRRAYLESNRAWITTDYVLDEVFTRLFALLPFDVAETFSSGVRRSIKDGSVMLERITPQRFDAAYRLRLRYRDKPRISFTDLTSFVVMTDLGLRKVLTGDSHFAQAGLGFQLLP
jgi:uncharacterized protein